MNLLVLVFAELTFNGFVSSYFLFNTDNRLIKIGAAMITGPLVLLLVLSLLLYFFKGTLFVNIFFYSYFVTSTIICFKFIGKKSLSKLFKLRFTNTKILLLLIIVLYIFFFFLFGSGFSIGGDANLYWGIATSFTRGNYPTVLPWQPNFLTVYHQGTFMVEGAIRALVPADISTIHNFFVAYLLSALLIFVTGIGWKISRSILALIPSIFLLILVGGPVILHDGFNNFIFGVINAGGSTLRTYTKNVFYNLSAYPGYATFQGSNGGGVVSIKEMFYNSFYTFGLAAFILFTYILTKHLSSLFRKYLLLITLTFLILGIDETFFLLCLLLLIGAWILDYKHIGFKKSLKYCLFFIPFSVFLFFAIQNPIRDSMLTPAPEYPRFKLVLENNSPFLRNLTYRKGQTIDWNGIKGNITAGDWPIATSVNYGAEKVTTFRGSLWKKMDYRFILAVVILGIFFFRSKYALLLAVGSVIAYISSLFILNTYWPPNVLRIINQADQLLFLAVGFLILYLWKIKDLRIKLPLLSLIFLVLLPQILVSHAKFLVEAVYTPHTYFTADQRDPLLTQVEKLVPDSSRIIFVDAYPDELSARLSEEAYSRHGFFVPMAPLDTKVLNPSISMEWYDAVNKLAPYALRKMKIDYVYVTEKGIHHLSRQRINQLNDQSFFIIVRMFDGGTLYKVTGRFKDLNDDAGTLKNLTSLIPQNKKVYLDKFNPADLRQIFLLNLSKRDHLVGKPTAHGGDFFMYIETDIPLERVCPDPCDPQVIKEIKGIEYAVMSQEDDPNVILEGNYEKIYSVAHIDLWKRKEP